MNRRLDDDLARLAFGDMTEREAKVMRDSIEGDADSSDRLNQYELLRGGLRKLRDVPPDQLSSERVREAILARGLSPRKSSAFGWLGWGAGVAAACLMVFAAMNVNVNRSSEPDRRGLVANSSTAADDLELDLRVDWKDYERAIESPVENVVSAPPRVGPVARQAESRTLSANVSGDAVQEDAPQRTKVARSESLILISSEQDQATGARRAYEVETQGLEDVLVSS